MGRRSTEYRALVDDFVVWKKSSASERGQDQGDGDRFQKEEDGCTTPVYSGRGCWRGGELEVPGRPHRQQTTGAGVGETTRLFVPPLSGVIVIKW